MVARVTGKAIATPTTAPPDLPAHGAHLWQIFLELHSARGSGGFAPNPISFSELMAWQQLRDCPLDPWEVDALRQIDFAYLAAAAKSAKAKAPPGKGTHHQ